MKIAIFGHIYNLDTPKYIKILLEELQKHDTSIYFEKNFYAFLAEHISIDAKHKTYSSFEGLDTSFELMITVGGDGTLLRSTTFIRHLEIPVIGINIGRLGFLATVKKDEIGSAIDAFFNKKYKIKNRSLLAVSTAPKIKNIEDINFALNEVTISRKDTASMITIETYLDDEYLTSYWADGLIISTPTGSTGYSLSCGGPVIKPQTKSVILTPIAPHNLNARPLVIPDETKIKMRIKGRGNEFFISLDSRITTIDSKTDIFIEQAPFKLKMVELENHSFIKTLREKLLWGEDTRNKYDS